MYEAYLHETSLPPELVIKNFVPDVEDDNYENYILEFLNASEWFMEKVGWIPFFHPVSEHFGECDCISGDYGIDLKLVLSNSELKRKSWERVLYYPQPDADMTVREHNFATRLHAALRLFDLEDLQNLDAQGFGQEYSGMRDVEVIKRDVKYFLNNLETEKNLLLFHGYEMFFNAPKPVPFADGIRELEVAFDYDFTAAMGYRQRCVGAGLETYIATIYDEHFVIFQWQGADKGFRFVDAVTAAASPVYMKLRKLSERRECDGQIIQPEAETDVSCEDFAGKN